ncbi:MAG: flagellar filament capping protein FliD [Lachnospiraceae bacterium]|nr:flagellar filament capping protein FliD [Lachnospiraceae bacterium]
MAANFAAINNVYNYYLTTYAPKSDSRFDTHKKSELRGVYNSIVNMNKEAPLFIVDKSQETKEYAVGIKENARAFHNTIASLGGLSEDELLNKKVAYSSNEDLAKAVYIGDDDAAGSAPSFTLGVNKLATTQLNRGTMIPSDSMYLPADTYSFDVGINGLSYEFQYNIAEGDTNKDIQDKLARLISNANIGLKASVEEDGKGNSALLIESENTGTPRNGGHMFNVSDENTSRTQGSVAYFGLNKIEQEASNSRFTINGMEKEAQGNTFTVEKLYEITLNSVGGEGETASINVHADLESVVDNISSFIDGYNGFIDTADSYTTNHPKSGRLVREMYAIASLHQEELESAGLHLREDGHIELDKDELVSEIASKGVEESVSGIRNFAAAMVRKTDQVALNPMHYADRTIVAYKNPGHNFATPYVTSAYTGMMFNSYC